MKNHPYLLRVSSRIPLVLALITGVAAWAQDGVKVYRVPKERPAAAGQAAGGLLPVSESALPSVTYATPQGWTELPPGQMRVASFKVQANEKIADVSVIPLPGAAGGDVPNVNRWRSQAGLGPLTEEAMTKAASKLEIGGQPALLHEIAGTNTAGGEPIRILGAIQHRDGMAWFFKMTGDDALVARQRQAFLEFLGSVKFVAPKVGELPPDHPPLDSTQLPPGHPEIGSSVSASASATVQVTGEQKLKWTVPAGWKEIPGGEFLYAKFTIAGEDGVAAVNVSTSAGDGGGLAANVNRWRGQLGQPAWSDAELQKQIRMVEAGGNKIQFVEMSGKDARSGQPAALVGAVVSRGDTTWFYKLMGDAKVVAVQKDAFNQFVQGVKY